MKSAPLSHIRNRSLSSLMPAICLQTLQQSRLSGPHDRDEGNSQKRGKRAGVLIRLRHRAFRLPPRVPPVHRSDRTKELTGKSRGGGICFYINNSWCDERNLHSIQSFCSPDLEFHMLLCRPFWLPREFTAIIITAVYIPPQANTDQALKELYENISGNRAGNRTPRCVVCCHGGL